MEAKLTFYPQNVWDADLTRHGDTGSSIAVRVVGCPPVRDAITLTIAGDLSAECCLYPATVWDGELFRITFDAGLVTLHGHNRLGIKATSPGYTAAWLTIPVVVIDAVTTGNPIQDHHTTEYEL